MNADCREFEKLLSDGINELPSSVAAHLLECSACAREWEAWQEISEAAPALRKEWESPDLWPRIRQSLEAEAEKAGRRRWRHAAPLHLLSPHWQLATAALVLVLSGLGGWMMLQRSQPASVEEERRLLTEQALDEIERSEGAYLRSIDKLSQLAVPKVRNPESAILSSYREKLLLIDSAIGELRNQVDRNRFNAHLGQELLLIYQEKQHTLEEILKDEAHAN